MTRPKPIRFDADRWLVMRNDPVIPKAVIQRMHGADGDRYLLIRWDLDPAKRQLMSVCPSLERADELVLYENPNPKMPPAGYPPRVHPSRTAGSSRQQP